MSIIIMKASDLKFAVGAQSALGGDFFVPAAFEDGAATAPQHGRERIEFIESGGEFAANFAFIGFERSGGPWLFREDHGGTPRIGDAGVQLKAGAQGSGGLNHSNENVFGAVAEQCAIAECESATLLQANASEGRAAWADLRFAKN
jgi:hypothetical protein